MCVFSLTGQFLESPEAGMGYFLTKKTNGAKFKYFFLGQISYVDVTAYHKTVPRILTHGLALLMNLFWPVNKMSVP